MDLHLPEVRWRLPPPFGRPTKLDLGDLQGNVLRGYANAHAAYILVEVGAPDAGRRLVADLLASVTLATTWATKPPWTLNLAFTHAGLAALGVPASTLARFPGAFRQGMRARARLLGDIGPSDPEHWEPGLDGERAHVLVSVTGTTADALACRVDSLLTRIDADPSLDVVHHQAAAKLADEREHFGFRDGFSQPAIEGAGKESPTDGIAGRYRWRPLPAGEMLLGYRDSDAAYPDGPPGALGRNATYVVYRKLYQDVAGFRDLVTRAGRDYPGGPDRLAAKLIGRWPDGTPTALSPDRPDPSLCTPATINDFRYADDPLGLQCPIGSHVRRANPRDGAGVGAVMTTRHRIVRRGIPYGPALPPGQPDDGQDRGLVFVGFNVDLERQFEFIQRQWLNDGDQLGLGPDPDPIVGTPTFLPRDVPAKLTIPGDPPRFVPLDQPLVVTRGGAYLFQPGRQALRELAG